MIGSPESPTCVAAFVALAAAGCTSPPITTPGDGGFVDAAAFDAAFDVLQEDAEPSDAPRAGQRHDRSSPAEGVRARRAAFPAPELRRTRPTP